VYDDIDFAQPDEELVDEVNAPNAVGEDIQAGVARSRSLDESEVGDYHAIHVAVVAIAIAIGDDRTLFAMAAEPSAVMGRIDGGAILFELSRSGNPTLLCVLRCQPKRSGS
jgi:hypothetical protein